MRNAVGQNVSIACVLTVCMVAGSGCGQRKDEIKLAPVTGRVMLDDKPLTTGTVYFIPDRSKGTKGPLSIGPLDAEGRYRIKGAGDRWGAVVGFHKIRIEVPTAATSEMSVAAQPEAANLSKYNDPETSGLTYEVKSGSSNQADFHLASKP